ncbi:MAG: putative membrane protein [Myxococcota bacterium]|jgi:putative membrane protein
MTKILFFAYLILFAVCAIEPYDRSVWWAENAPVLLVVAAIAISNRYHRYSTLSLALMTVFITLHTIGGHYTFERVPFDWFSDAFGFERNHYDRIAHFSVGLYAFPLAEILKRNRLVNTNWILYLFPLFAIISVAGVYELFEWQYAISVDPDAGNAVLGSQGDVWDAQKDIFADTLGALFALLIFKIKK